MLFAQIHMEVKAGMKAYMENKRKEHQALLALKRSKQ